MRTDLLLDNLMKFFTVSVFTIAVAFFILIILMVIYLTMFKKG